MIDWKAMKDLHVIQKLHSIVGDWFGVDLIFVDSNGRIQSDVMEKDYHFYNHFFKVQMQTPHGYHVLGEEVEKWIDFQNKTPGEVVEFDSFFKGAKWYCSEVIVDGECLGMVMAYPFAHESWTSEHEKFIHDYLVDENSVESHEAKLACDKLPKLYPRERNYLKELVSVISEEIATYHDEISKREDRISELNSEVSNRYRYHHMIGKSKSMQKVYHLLEKISKSESTVLIQGSNGTGKELVAKAIHYNSPRKDAVFLAQNCSAFNDNLLDSELFGHVKGSFTGAVKDKKGLFETANGGTLFLDEIGDTSLSMQVKLLRVLQEGTFLPVGATSPRKVNVRVIAATNKPLKEMIAKGEFREDLYYRLNVINLALPPLKDRVDDIPILVDHFLEKRCAEMGVPTKQLTKKTLEKLLMYEWPGNVRQLENEVEKLVVLAGDEKMITPEYLSEAIVDFGEDEKPSFLKGVNLNGSLKSALEELECLMIREGLKRCNFNKSRLAKELGISRAGLIMKVEKYELDKRKKLAGE